MRWRARRYHFMVLLDVSPLSLPISLQLHVEVDLITNCPSECVQSGLALARSVAAAAAAATAALMGYDKRPKRERERERERKKSDGSKLSFPDDGE